MRHKNGLEVAIRKIGKRLYLRKDLFNAGLKTKYIKINPEGHNEI